MTLTSEEAKVKKQFQNAAEKLIKQRCAPEYFAEARLRMKLGRWNLQDLPGRLPRKVMRVFALLSSWCSPRVQAAYFRSVFNGWVTDRRLNTLVQSNRGCCLQCGWEDDALDHYATCSKFWLWVAKPRPQGLDQRRGRALAAQSCCAD